MNWFKIIFASALSIILVVSASIALFGAGKMVSATLRTYVLNAEECRYGAPRIAPTEEPAEEGDREEPKEECFVDYNGAKRDIADGVGKFLVSTPLAWFMYRQTRKMMEEIKEE